MSDSPTLRITNSPAVYLVGRQQIDQAQLDLFLADEGVEQWTTDTEVGSQKLVEVAGRLCYMSFAKPRPGGNSAYIGHILEVGHGSVLEHAVFNLIITGVSRSFSHELVRHRAGFGYSQLSQRFVDESDAVFVVPPGLREEVAAARELLESDSRFDGDIEYALDYSSEWGESLPLAEFRKIHAGLLWLQHMGQALDVYKRLSDYGMQKHADIADATLRRKRAREAARSVLPNATETKIAVTGNARALRHFIETRGDAAADAEIRNVAWAVLRVLADAAPSLFGDYTVTNGSISTPHPKV